MSEKKKDDQGAEGKRRLYLVDGSSFAHRAFHVTERQGLSTSKGLPTGATLVFTNMLLRLIREEKPTHLAVVWDARGKTFRHEKYPEYKATRVKMPSELSMQIEYMRKIASAFNLAGLEKAGFEADDCIGTLVKQAAAEGMETVIVSSDKDLAQLVGPGVVMLDTMKNSRLDAEGVKEKFGVGPDRMADMLALMGDSSDNVPGVPLVGEMKAPKLLAEYGTLDNVLAHAHEVKGKVGQNLVAFADQARLSRELVTLVTDVPLEFNWDDLKLREPDLNRLTELFKELEFNKLLHEFSRTADQFSYDRYRLLTEPATLKAFAAQIEKAGFISVDTETTSLDPMSADLVGISMALEPQEAVYVPLGHAGPGSERQMPRVEALKIIAPLLADPKIKKIGQNLKYDYQVLSRAGVEMRGLEFDTMIASYLINPKRRTHNLEELASEYLGHQTITYEEVCGKGKSEIGFAEVPLEKALKYSGEDADVALMLRAELAPKLEAIEERKLFDEVEMPLVPALARMEMTGVKVDVERLAQLSEKFDGEIEKLRERIFKLAGEEFNLDSPKQLAEVLFEKLKLTGGKKTKTGFSTSVEVLAKLAEEHELPKLILEYRTQAKLKSTYTDALPRLVHPETGRIHTSYNQTVTSTGRLSSSDPNLQNIPVRSAEGKLIREAFIGEGENLILSADYSQVELRLLAHITGELSLLESFAREEDIHARTAAEVFGVPLKEVSADLRRRAKVINFGLLYGMSAHGLSVQLGIEHGEAQDYIDCYFKRYPLVQLYMKSIVAEARAKGHVSTIMGRRMPLPEIYSANFIVRQAAEREAINAPLQGSAADVIKVAMIRIDEALRQEKWKAKMIMQVHDELVFEVPPRELKALCKLAAEKMEGAAELKVRLRVDLSHGRTWAEAH